MNEELVKIDDIFCDDGCFYYKMNKSVNICKLFSVNIFDTDVDDKLKTIRCDECIIKFNGVE